MWDEIRQEAWKMDLISIFTIHQKAPLPTNFQKVYVK